MIRQASSTGKQALSPKTLRCLFCVGMRIFFRPYPIPIRLIFSIFYVTVACALATDSLFSTGTMETQCPIRQDSQIDCVICFDVYTTLAVYNL